MASHGCLLAVIRYYGWSKTFLHKIPCMLADGVKSFGGDIVAVFLREVETAAESGLAQPVEQIGKVVFFLFCIRCFLQFFIRKQRWLYVSFD